MSIVAEIEKSKVFLWQPKNKSNPKTEQYRLWVVDGMVVLDPVQIERQLQEWKEIISEAKKNNKQILVICEKSVYSQELEDLSQKVWFHYLNHKVPSGVLTNFDTLLSRIKSLKDLRWFVNSHGFESLTKKEQSMKKRELKKVEQVYKWVVDLRKKPDLVVIVDGQYMHKFVSEIQKMNSPAIVLASSDFNKRIDQHLVMCNTNSLSSLKFVMKYLFWQ